MDAVERYLATVASLLPRAQRDDIRAELRDRILNEVEEKEAGLGRPLEKDEIDALLKRVGNPLVVAASYGGRNQLVGPDIYPFFRIAVLVALGVSTLAHLVIMVMQAVTITPPGPAIVGTLGSYWMTSVYLFGLVVAIAALIERSGATHHLVDAWRPRDLPPPARRRHGAAERIAEIVLGVFIVAWLAGQFGGMPWDRPWTGEGIELRLSPALEQIRWVLAGLMGAQILVSAHALLRPAQAFPNAIVEALVKLAFLGVIVWVLNVGALVSLSGEDAARIARLDHAVQRAIAIGLAVTLLISVADVFFALRRVVRTR